jgi:hypothetical protein
MLRSIRHVLGVAALWLAMAGMAEAIPTASFVGPDPEKRCFANTLTPASYDLVTERVMIRAEFERQRHIPAVYEQRRQRVMVKSPMVAYQTVAPVYALKFEDILVEPAREIEVNIPAKYETWTEEIEIEPAKTVWKRGTGLYGHTSALSAANITDRDRTRSGGILCKVRIPAQKRIVHHTRMVSPPRKETQIIPARYERVAKQVVQRPGFARRVSVSAEYAAIPYEKQLAAARHETEIIPAAYQDVEREVVTTPSSLVRAEVLCDQMASRETVRQLQSALVDRGYEIRVDGIYGPETQGAVERFQRDHALSRGYMTMETIQALEVTPAICSGADCPPRRVQTTVMAAQAALSDAGYYAAQDGIHGPQTQTALERFQQANGLEVGFLSAETMTALNIIARI